MTTEFSGNDGDFYDSWRSLSYGTGTRTDKRLPAPSVAPAIPARTGVAPHVVKTASTGGGVDMTLKGPKVVTSSDGLITINYPESAEVVVGAATIVLPVISTS